MTSANFSSNVDQKTVEGFGDEWAAFDQSSLGARELQERFQSYFSLFPFQELQDAEGFDLGSGSGRWAAVVAPRVGKLHCIDPSEKALQVCRRALERQTNVEFHLATSDAIPLADGSQDFGYCLGVLHHIPDTERAMQDCVAKLRPEAPFLVYIYYAMENRPQWFRILWRASDIARRLVSKLPFAARKMFAEIVAVSIYLPLSRAAKVMEKAGADVSAWPLSTYRSYGYYSMRTDALDRFGTRLEQRFSREEIEAMMRRCGLREIKFSDEPPFWVAIGRRAKG